MDLKVSRRECAAVAERAWEPVGEMLTVGQCEPLKAGVHGALLMTAALCASYNSAAWLKRRERHLAINAIIYGMAVWWEHRHVTHHLAACGRPEPASLEASVDVSDAA